MMERGGVVGLLGNLRSGALWGLTFGRARGLFVYMPVLLLVVFAIRRIRGHPREEYAWFALANILVVFFANLAFNGWWWGGVNAGARYQIVALPFWVSLLVLLPPGGRLRGGLMLLTAGSLANMLVIAAVSPMAPDALRGSPLLFAWAKLIGVVRLDLGLDTLVASGGALSRGSLHIYPTFLMRDWPIGLQDGRIADWAVFNLGERLLGLRGSVSLVPVLAWIGVFTSLGLRAPVPESEASDTEP
ncbi:MAG: hypothetical protein AMS19_12185 [Gemmatimonas sp. SG8_23]|nr:MAG: hypothetical protein AMS19_12185 [Gemmatimonas sp. SG8_23]